MLQNSHDEAMFEKFPPTSYSHGPLVMAQNTQAAHDPFFLNNHLDMSSVPPEDNTNDKSPRSVSPPQARRPIFSFARPIFPNHAAYNVFSIVIFRPLLNQRLWLWRGTRARLLSLTHPHQPSRLLTLPCQYRLS